MTMEGPIAISTEDFALYHDLIRILRERKEKFISVPLGSEVPDGASVLICAPSEMVMTSFPRTVSDSDARSAVIKALDMREGSQGGTLVIGVDPGMKSGYAMVLRGQTIDAGTVSRPEDLQMLVSSTIHAVSPSRTVLRIGHGDPVNRDRCTRSLFALVDEVEVVDESRTSGRTCTDHIDAAETIARCEGEGLDSMPEVYHTAGSLREIQRESRRLSGDVTISTPLAEDVAHGRLSMEEAIGVQRLRAEAHRRGSSL